MKGDMASDFTIHYFEPFDGVSTLDATEQAQHYSRFASPRIGFSTL